MKSLLPIAVFAVALPALAVDGVTLINQSTLATGGGFFTISQPGSYKLSGNLLGNGTSCAFALSANISCAIYVTAPNVNIDLNGFTISVPRPASSEFPVAILQGPSATTLTIRNGTIAIDPYYTSNHNAVLGLIPSGSGYVALSFVAVMDLSISGSGSFGGVSAPYLFDRVMAPASAVVVGGASCPGLVSNSVLGITYDVCSTLNSVVTQHTP